MNLYLQIFTENIWRASLVPMGSNATLYAMKLFGGYNMPLAVLLAITGGMIGQTLNLLVGYGLLYLRTKGILRVNEKAYNSAQKSFYKYYVFCLLLFGWAAGGNVLVAIAGFLGARMIMVLPLVAVGYIVNYGLLLF